MATFREGDEVRWNTSQGTTHGRVVDIRTREFTFDGQHFKASDDDPRYIVESDKTGARAAHTGDALEKG
jgi:hypothetical protein